MKFNFVTFFSGRSRFVGLLEFTQRDGRQFELTEPLGFFDAMFCNLYEVPKGFVTDLASVPRPLWWLFPPFGLYTRAAILHDYLYRDGRMPRRDCDALFLEAMRVSSTPWLTRTALFVAVRAFGWIAFSARHPLNRTASNRIPRCG